MSAPRSLLLHFVIVCVALLLSHPIYAWSDQYTPYQDKLLVPPYVTDAKPIIFSGAARHDWRVIAEKPGQITTELRSERDQALVVVNTLYGADFIRLEVVSATSLNCAKGSSCAVQDALIQRWMINLRREYALALLNAAIVDTGGTVIDDAMLKARFRSPEQSLAAPSATEVARVAEDLFRGMVTGEQYHDLAAERLVQFVAANPTEEQQKQYDNTIEWLGMALAKAGNGRYREVLERVTGTLQFEGLRRKYKKLLTSIPVSDTAQYRVGSATLPTFVDNYVEGLKSNNPLFVQNVAVIMREAGEKRPELFELSAKRIAADRHDSNRYVASASAHLCRFLITSNDPRYADLYRSLLELSANRSMRNAAKDGLVMLGLLK
jgi:hypothetical protein